MATVMARLATLRTKAVDDDRLEARVAVNGAGRRALMVHGRQPL
jgi:hypothetical protein